MIDDYLAFLEYYSGRVIKLMPYADPFVRIEYDEITKDGKTVIAKLAPFAHAINALCYRDPDEVSIYSKKRIADICHVSAPEVSAWKNEDRIPKKYSWFLLLVDISNNARNSYGEKIIHPESRKEAENICDVHLRMIQSSYEPFCADDNVLMKCVWHGYGLETAKSGLLKINPGYWDRIFKTKRFR